MIKYAKVIDENKGLCEVGLGTNSEYYQSIGMILMDVEESDIDYCWYLAEKCPHKSEAQKLQEAKDNKYKEANSGAKSYIENEALFEFEEGKHIEATDGNIAKMTAYALAFVTGQLQPEDTVAWNTKEDETVELTQEQIGAILNGLGQVQAFVWAIKYPYFVQLIDAASTVEEVDAIEIDYSTEIDVEE